MSVKTLVQLIKCKLRKEQSNRLINICGRERKSKFSSLVFAGNGNRSYLIKQFVQLTTICNGTPFKQINLLFDTESCKIVFHMSITFFCGIKHEAIYLVRFQSNLSFFIAHFSFSFFLFSFHFLLFFFFFLFLHLLLLGTAVRSL